jgi:transaldolase
VLYVKALQAPFTINTMPEQTLLDLADHGEIGELLPADGGDAEAALARLAQARVDVGALAAQLQQEAPTGSCSRGTSCWPASPPRASC